MLPKAIIIQIEQKFGVSIRYPKDCEGLSHALKIACKQHISPSTLKRLLGFAKNVEQPRKYTLDALANYIGYKDWDECVKFTENQDNSSFFLVEGVETKNLKKGSKVEFTYDPKRNVSLLYLGKEKYEVVTSKNSKLQEGDILLFSYMAINHPLITADVLRNKKSLGKFTAGKINGITSIKITD